MATGGRAHDMERFAFDSFVFTMSRFKTNAVVPKPQSSENNYEQPDFLRIISTGYIAYQLQMRDIWKSEFVTAYKSSRFRKFKQISAILEEEFEKMYSVKRIPSEHLIISIALVNELIQFLYSKSCQLFLNDIASLWRTSFARFQEEFEEQGGLLSFYLYHKDEKARTLDVMINKFITKYCIPYGKREVSVSALFCRLLKETGYLSSPKKDVDTQNTHNKDEFDQSAFDSRFRETLSISSRSPRKSEGEKTRVSDTLENAGLGIHQHGDIIQDAYYLSVDKDAFLEKCDTESYIEGASAAAHADVKLHRKILTQPSREQVKCSKELTTQIASPEVQSKGRGGLIGSPLTSEGQSKNRGGLIGSPLSSEGQLTGRGDLAGSPASLQEQKHRGDSPRTPKRISRLEQKRLKYLQLKKN